MDLIRRETVRELLEAQAGPCLSVFAPLHPGTSEARQDPIRLRKFLSPAEEQLVDRGLGRHAARELLAPLRHFSDGNTPWKYEGRGLAMFLAPGFERTFPLAEQVEEGLYVDDRFHLRPILPLVTEGDHFFVLALSQNQVRLLEGWPRGLVDRGFPGPHEFDETTNVNHTMRGDKVHEGIESSVDRRAAHVQGPHKSKEDVRHFVREVAGHVDERLRGESTPLVLATTELLARLWREESKYPHTVEAFVEGNADYLATDELHARAWPLVVPALAAERQAARQQLQSGDRRPRMTFDLRDVVAAAMHGQVDTLFIDCSRPLWGRIDAASGTVELHERPQPGDADLVEVAAGETLRHDGHVFPLERPVAVPQEAAEALLRY